MELNKTKYFEEVLLNRFNRRDSVAFNEVYELYYNELIKFAGRMFFHTKVSVDDIIQDIYLTIWENKTIQFDSLVGIKAYIYVCIKNKLKNHIIHNKHVCEYNHNMLKDDFFIIQVAESEIMSVISQAIDLLPEECSKVFQLHLEGWEVQDIAIKLNKAESTVYKQRNRALQILKNKMYSQLTTILMLMR